MTESRSSVRGRRGWAGGGAYIYEDYKDNHVIWRGRKDELEKFLVQLYENLQHKVKRPVSRADEIRPPVKFCQSVADSVFSFAGWPSITPQWKRCSSTTTLSFARSFPPC